MNYETFQFISSIFKPIDADRPLTFDEVTTMREFYPKIVEAISGNTLLGATGSDNARRMLFDKPITQYLDEIPADYSEINPRIPALNSDHATTFISTINARYGLMQSGHKFDQRRHDLVQAMSAALMFELGAILPTLDEVIRDYANAVPLAEFISYASWKTISSGGSFDHYLGIEESKKAIDDLGNLTAVRIEKSAENIRATLQDDINQSKAELQNLIKESTKAGNEIGDTYVEILRKIRTAEQELDAIGEKIDTSNEAIESFGKAIREELKIDTTKRLWDRRAIQNSRAFMISSVLIVACLVLPPVFAFTHLPVVISTLREIGDAATQGIPNEAKTAQLTAATISRLAIITAPLALYFWGIKLLIRFNLRSLALMDDARQRQTTMDTYFHLVENSKATPEERGLMLNALFRPLPGQGSDGVDPPKVVELSFNNKAN